MATLRSLTALQRATHISYVFSQCYVARKLNVYQLQEFSNRKTVVLNDEDTAISNKPKHKPKTVIVPKITLLLPDNSMTVINLENAESLAKRRKLNLVKVSDPGDKTDRTVYKLTNSLVEDIEVPQDNKINKKSKSSKLFYISATITKNDLSIKTKNIVKLLDKDNPVKICITLSDTEDADILNTITEMVKDIGSIKKLSSKKKMVLFLITPLDKKNMNKSVDNKEEIAMSDTIN